jgi:hypothetical protein
MMGSLDGRSPLGNILTLHTLWCILYAMGVIMPLLQVRECPEDIYRKITIVAKNENRTIAQQVVVLLKKSLGQEESNIERRKNIIEKIQKRIISDDIKKMDAVALIREDRDR